MGICLREIHGIGRSTGVLVGRPAAAAEQRRRRTLQLALPHHEDGRRRLAPACGGERTGPRRRGGRASRPADGRRLRGRGPGSRITASARSAQHKRNLPCGARAAAEQGPARTYSRHQRRSSDARTRVRPAVSTRPERCRWLRFVAPPLHVFQFVFALAGSVLSHPAQQLHGTTRNRWRRRLPVPPTTLSA